MRYEVQIAKGIWLNVMSKPNNWVRFWQFLLFGWKWTIVDMGAPRDAVVTYSELEAQIIKHEKTCHNLCE